MADFPALPLFTDAYLADTRHLTTEEHGAYLLLLMEAWRRADCSLPDDDRLLSRLSGLEPKRWAEVKPIVMSFWKRDGRRKVWTQKRLFKERSFLAEKSASQRDKATSRWNKTKKDYAAALPNGCPEDAPTPTPTPTLSKEEEEGARESQIPPDPEIWTPDLLHSEVMAAVGLKSGQMPRYWMPPSAPIHVWRWHNDLGLTPEQVIEVARSSRKNHPEPPNGPKALDGAMQHLADVLAAKPMEPNPNGTKPRTGAANARLAFDSALNAALNAAPVGASLVDRSRSDPFAKQRR